MTSPSITSLRLNLARTGELLQAADNIGRSQDLSDLYFLIGFLVFLVEREYPALPCRAGCSQCCIDSGLPRVSAPEWALIHAFLTTLAPELLAQIVARNERLHRPQLALFLAEQERLAQPEKKLPVPAFSCAECPFLVEGLCQIYPVRPAICRAYGYFSWRREPGEDSQIFACRMAADQLLESLQAAGSAQVALPVWNLIQAKIYALNDGALATLPLWLMAHTTPEGLSAYCANPDFLQLAAEKTL